MIWELLPATEGLPLSEAPWPATVKSIPDCLSHQGSGSQPGSLMIGGMSTWSLAISSRTDAMLEHGQRLGPTIPGQSSFHPQSSGLWTIPGLRHDGVYRSKLILAGAVPTSLTVEIRVVAQCTVSDPTQPRYRGSVQRERLERCF